MNDELLSPPPFPPFPASPFLPGSARWVGPELPAGRTIRFEYLDTEGNTLLGAAVANTRQVVITLPAVPGQPAAELRVHLRNTLP